MAGRQRVRLGVTIALVCLHLLAIAPDSAWTQPFQQSVRFVPPARPAAIALTGKVRLSGPRCPCSFMAQKPTLTALAFSQKKSTSRYVRGLDVWGYTTKDYPTFWFYIPRTSSKKYFITFRLENLETQKSIYETAIATPDQAGIVAISLPLEVQPLEVGKRYRWVLSTTCEPGRLSDYILDIYGVVVRINLEQSLISRLASATPQQQARLYAENGIWYDAITTLGQLRQKYPQDADFSSIWRSLLESVNLQDIAEQPLLPTHPKITPVPFATIPSNQECRP